MFEIQKTYRRILISSAAVGLGAGGSILGGAAAAQDLPAVSGVNGSLAIAGGVAHHGGYTLPSYLGGYVVSDGDFLYSISEDNHYRDDFLDVGTETLGLVLGSLAVPLGDDFGAQFDGAAGVQGGDFVGGVGAHLFWRDPDRGLLGVTSAAARNSSHFEGMIVDDIPIVETSYPVGYAEVDLERQSIYRTGAEAELYLDRFTLHGAAGYQWGEAVDSGFFVEGGADYFATDDFLLGLGGGASDEIGAFATATLEFRPREQITLFADFRTEFEDYFHAVAGIRIGLGSNGTLIEAHRQDYVANNLGQDAFAAMRTKTTLAGFDCCFTGETEILMVDGTYCPIADVSVGDRIIGEGGEINTVLHVETPLLGDRKLYAFNDGPAFVTAEHPFKTRDGWKSIDPVATRAETGHFGLEPLRMGDQLLMLAAASFMYIPSARSRGGAEVKSLPEIVILTAYQVLARISEHADDPIRPVYNLRLDGNHTYFANRCLVHNK